MTTPIKPRTIVRLDEEHVQILQDAHELLKQIHGILSDTKTTPEERGSLLEPHFETVKAHLARHSKLVLLERHHIVDHVEE